jgi:hypothetical protein
MIYLDGAVDRDDDADDDEEPHHQGVRLLHRRRADGSVR